MAKKTLADLRTEAANGARREQRQPVDNICLALDMGAKAQQLEAELAELRIDLENAEAEVEFDENGRGSDGRQRKMVEGGETVEVADLEKAVADKESEVDACYDEMRDYIGTIYVAPRLSLGDWLRFCQDNPAALPETPGYERDRTCTFGACSTEALVERLPEFVAAWNDEELAPGEFALAGSDVSAPVTVGPRDALEIARGVAVMYEVLQLGKVVRGLSATRSAERD